MTPWLRPFRLAGFETSLVDLLGKDAPIRLESKFKEHSPDEVAIATREAVRFLFLVANSPTTLFFPGDGLIDDIWHALIVETAEYRKLCETLCPGAFIEHSGQRYEDYSSERAPEALHEEQLSWLCSYFRNFGEIEEAAYRRLALARNLAGRMGINRADLNRLAASLVVEVDARTRKNGFSLAGYLERIEQSADLIDRDIRANRNMIAELMSGLGLNASQDPVLLTNRELESLFEASTAIAFTLWQHMTAVERLGGLAEWKSRNPDQYSRLARGTATIGLGTTHLARDGSPILSGTPVHGGFEISGSIPFASGYGIFDEIYIGFACGEELLFAVVPFPNPLRPSTIIGAKVLPYQLAILHGTSTVRIELQNYFVPEGAIANRFKKGQPRPQGKSVYQLPDLGIAKRAIRECARLSEGSKSGKMALVQGNLPHLKERLAEIEKARDAGSDDTTLEFRKDELIRDAVRLLVLASGGASLMSGSIASRLHAETLLLDTVIQPPDRLRSKIEKTSHG